MRDLRAFVRPWWGLLLVLVIFSISYWWSTSDYMLGGDAPLSIPRTLVVETEGMIWAIDTEKLLMEYAPLDTVSLVDSTGTLYWQGTRNELLSTLKEPLYYEGE